MDEIEDLEIEEKGFYLRLSMTPEEIDDPLVQELAHRVTNAIERMRAKRRISRRLQRAFDRIEALEKQLKPANRSVAEGVDP